MNTRSLTMVKYGLPIIFTLISFFSTTRPCLAAARPLQPPITSNTEFIKNSCESTLYPDICYKSLSSYATTIQTNPTELANTAISVALKAAQSASNMVLELSKARDLSHMQAGAVGDCVETMDDSVEELQKSMEAMKDIEGQNYYMEKSNVQTWVSAALTDADTCMDGFEVMMSDENKGKGKGKGKAAVKSNVLRVAQLSSNALAFINRL